MVEQAAGVRTGELEAAHVGDIKQADGLTDRLVLVDDRCVLHRHLPAGKVHHPATS